jgi:protein-tyrosine phosphatase
MVKVLFLCLGNICRSPMAQAVFQQMVNKKRLHNFIAVDSAGLGGWHIGEIPHEGTRDVLNRQQIGYDGIFARQVKPADLVDFDYIVAMDAANVDGLRKMGDWHEGKVFRLLDPIVAVADKDVPDPYYTGEFDRVYELIQLGCAHLLEQIVQEHALPNED